MSFSSSAISAFSARSKARTGASPESVPWDVAARASDVRRTAGESPEAA